MSSVAWHCYNNGQTLGQQQDNGIVLLDEDCGLGARVILEHSPANNFYVVTWGVYGWGFRITYYDNLAAAELAVSGLKKILSSTLADLPAEDSPEFDAKAKGVFVQLESLAKKRL